ncbi:diacylglycerol kinase family lipid kinase [Candidatus Woesebacteria bacterium]|nr:diacylglycerol kinase family lipid kinase [Candidatus Woesebacteria bacterium]
MRILFIVNPRAGLGRAEKQIAEVVRQLVEKGRRIDVIHTKAPLEAINIAKKSIDQGYEMVVAVGGDGTINEVINGLANSEVTLGVLPTGTGNVFAKAVGIPVWAPFTSRPLHEASDILFTGYRYKLDLGRLMLADQSVRYFLMWCGVGLDAAVILSLSSKATIQWGVLGWIKPIIQTVLRYSSIPMHIAIDGEELKIHDTLLTLVSNNQLYAKFWQVSPDARMDDGYLDLALFRGSNWVSFVRLLAKVTLGNHVGDPKVLLQSLSTIHISSEIPVPVHVDAEIQGTTPVMISVVPNALNVVIPSKRQ